MKYLTKTRVLSVILVLVMVVSMLPMAAFATEPDQEKSTDIPVAETTGETPEVSDEETTEAAAGEAAGEPEVQSEETVDYTFADFGMTVLSDKESTLAPGVAMNEVVIYNESGNRVEMYITTTDLSVDTVNIYANYLNNQNVVLGMSKLTEQVAAAQERNTTDTTAPNYNPNYTVVAGINASYYNMTTGKPTGAFVMEGNDITNESEGNNYSFFAILDDGTAYIGGKGEYSQMKDRIVEAVGGYHHIVEDGAIVSGLNDTTLYPRQTVGVTADGRVVTMTADGNQAPASVGLTIQEQAEMMLALGCVEAIHLDGGGSCTFGAKAEGADGFEIMNSPSDGSERSVSNSLIIVSTAVADGTFDHATLTVENAYVTPGSTVSVSATGVDAAGGPAEIPADIYWQVADSAMGTAQDGVFTSSGIAGDAVVQMVYNGNVVGETTVHVVIPDSLEFSSTQITVPYGKSVELGIAAYYGVNKVALKDGDIAFSLSDAASGTITGFVFTACEESAAVSDTTVTATLTHNTELTASALITMGKGSEVIFDFEDGTNQTVVINETPGTKYNYVFPESTNYIVTAENGQVHSGSYALAADINYGNSLESGYMKTSIYAPETRVFENAVSVGCWIYIPDELVGLWARWTLTAVTGYNEDGSPIYGSSVNGNTMDTTAGGTGVVYTFDEPGWHYLYVDTSAYDAVAWRENGSMIQLYISDRDGSAYNYYAAQQSNIPANYTIYIDDITVDYSSAVDDREAPVFSDITYAVSGMADAAVLNNQTVTSNVVTFAASVADYTGKSNHTGIDASSVKAYIDGVEVEADYANGFITVSDYALTNGKHVIKFAAEDKMGNYGYKYGYITVNAEESASTVKLVAADPDAAYIKLGSIYNMDLVSTAIEEVQSVVVSIDLDNNSTWQLDHMILADGFEAEYTIGYDNVATITITRAGGNETTGEATLATLPVRVWTLKTGYTYENGTKAGQAAYTLAQFKSMKEFWRMSVIANVDMGILTRVDGSEDTFTGERVFCDTEMWANYGNMTATDEGLAYFNAWDGGHVHTEGALEDQAASCTQSGYTGRTYCAGCDSVVDWGSTVSPNGHSYEQVEGVLQCTDCGKPFNGVHTDGKTYVDGVVTGDGWSNDSYYVDGVALTGVRMIDGVVYDFGDNGISRGKYSGLFELDGELYYAVVGTRAAGWIYEAEAYYYFDTTTYAAVDGNVTIDDYKYEFVDKQLYNGCWVHNADGSVEYVWAGTKLGSQWFTLRENTYYFDNNCKLATGVCLIKLSTGGDSQFFVFDENGVFIEAVTSTGCYAYKNAVYFLNQGVVQTGLQEENGVYYYFRSNYQMYTGTYRFVDDNAANGLVTAGYCWFDAEDHHLLNNEFADPDGDGVESYYIMGRAASGGQWVEQDGKSYYLNGNGAPVKGAGWVDGVYYYFDTEDGHLCDYEFIIRNDTMYYCIGGQIQYLGLVEIDGYTYYISTNSGRVMRSCGYWVSGNKNPTGKDQLYYFDENGRRRDEEFFTIDGVLYYMIDGQPAKLGLFEHEGGLYYASTNSGAIKTGKYYIEGKNANGYTGNCYYYFGEDGKALNEEFYTESGSLYYLINGLPCKDGLVLIDGSYYYLSTNSGAAKCGVTYYVLEKNANGLLPEGWYTFDADGKIVF